MATRTFPIFRILQRAIGGSAGAGKHKPALAAAARIQGKREEARDEGTEEGNGESHMDASEEVGDEILLIDKSSWPINSEAASQLRREFAQEGFRRLYSTASVQMRVMGAGGGNQSANENEGNDAQHDGDDAVSELTRAIDAGPNRANNEDETPLVIPSNDNGDWVYYAQ
mmetsp:Transcript_4464/g.9662  ORF Transcript_4464/g.9662 Transcript_4464/m.9662 type:complete len:170 (-) Transcript_4464:17-526(-)